MTTDPFPKEHAIRVETAAGAYHVGGTCKGSGMIEPMLATMLGFVTTDAAVPPALLQRALIDACETTFNAITVDGECSTNDTVFALASGASGVGHRRGRLRRLRRSAARGLPRAGDGHRPRRRGRDQADHRAGDRRADLRRRAARGARHRQLAAGEDGDPRRRPELGPPRRRRRPLRRGVLARRRAGHDRRHRAVRARAAVRRARRRRPPPTCRARTSASPSISAPTAARTPRCGPAISRPTT